jgi:hypothetical protein
MPLWKIHHSEGAYTPRARSAVHDVAVHSLGEGIEADSSQVLSLRGEVERELPGQTE